MADKFYATTRKVSQIDNERNPWILTGMKTICNPFFFHVLSYRLDVLTKVSAVNQDRLNLFHPAAFLNGHWLWYV